MRCTLWRSARSRLGRFGIGAFEDGARCTVPGVVLAAILVSAATAHAGSFGSGPKLIGTGAAGSAAQGYSVALSSDGNTALVGAPYDASSAGAAWVFTRSGGIWAQQGGKLVGTGAAGAAGQGWSVGLSSDGNTALVGGPGDFNAAGAVWVFTRSGGVWTQQGGKLVGTGASGSAQQGSSVALSSDGDTAIVGGFADGSNAGASWVFTRSAGVWTQQGNKLVGTGAVGAAQQGYSAALSSDGNTAIVGGWVDNSDAGAAWVFTRSGGIWTQQGGKLVGTGAPDAAQGYSVGLSSDGNTAIVGGPHDGSLEGAVWVFTRGGGVWTQQGDKLVGTGANGAAQQGSSAALSSDGNTAIVGGPHDGSDAGAAWVFTRSAGIWTQVGDKLIGTGLALPIAEQGWSVGLSSDGKTAIVGGPGTNLGAAWVFTKLCLHGNVNGDGALDVVDVFYLINYLFAGGPPPQCY
jgi:hypothetical protein